MEPMPRQLKPLILHTNWLLNSITIPSYLEKKLLYITEDWTDCHDKNYQDQLSRLLRPRIYTQMVWRNILITRNKFGFSQYTE